jgi:TPR repeat protein
MVGDCYSTGFGVERNISEALSWYERAARAGSVEAAEAFLRVLGPKSARERLPASLYCQWLCRVLLSAFEEENDGMKRQTYSGPISRLRHLLCAHPEFSSFALENAVENFLKMKDVTPSEMFYDTTVRITASAEWFKALEAIRTDDQEALRLAISQSPTILQGRPDGSHSLAYVAAESGHAGLLRMLVDEYGVDCQLPNTDGVTPLACAIRLGHTAAVRVLIFSDKNVKLDGDISAMDTGAGGDSSKIAY